MAFKMKGFPKQEGISPMKQKQDNKYKLEMERQKKILAVDSKMEALEEQRFNEEITQEQYDKAMKPLRIQEKAVKKPL